MNEAEPGVTALAAAMRRGRGGGAVGTVSIAGPRRAMTKARIRELAPLVMQCATELSSAVAAAIPRIAHEARRQECREGGVTRRSP